MGSMPVGKGTRGAGAGEYRTVPWVHASGRGNEKHSGAVATEAVRHRCYFACAAVPVSAAPLRSVRSRCSAPRNTFLTRVPPLVSPVCFRRLLPVRRPDAHPLHLVDWLYTSHQRPSAYTVLPLLMLLPIVQLGERLRGLRNWGHLSPQTVPDTPSMLHLCFLPGAPAAGRAAARTAQLGRAGTAVRRGGLPYRRQGAQHDRAPVKGRAGEACGEGNGGINKETETHRAQPGPCFSSAYLPPATPAPLVVHCALL